MCQGWVCKDDLTSNDELSRFALRPHPSGVPQYNRNFISLFFFISQKKYQSTENEIDRLRVTNDTRVSTFFVLSMLLR